MIGTTVTVRQLPGINWVVRCVDGDGRLHLRSKRTSRGHSQYTSRVCGSGDVSVTAPPPTFTPGIEIEHDGRVLVVREDKGDEVICATQDTRWIWRDGTRLRVRGGNSYTLNKADVVVEAGRLTP